MDFYIPILESQRLKLRELTETDVTVEYINWLNDPEVNQFLELRFISHTLESVKKEIQIIKQQKNIYFWAIIESQSNRHIGNIKLGPINPYHNSAEIGLLIGEKSCWGKGYGTESIRLVVQFAFQKLKLHKLTAGFYALNMGSQKAFRKNGFIIEGRLKDQYGYENQYMDGIKVGLINSDE